MMTGLLGKELRQHGFTLAFLMVIVLGGLALIGGNRTISHATGGGFAAVQLLLVTFVPLACLVLGQVLIATEFRQKTQLFLEGLPLPRWRMLAVKFALGLVVVVAAIGAALVVAWWRARHSEAMTPRFATLLGLKSLAWVWFFYTLCFAHAFLGRYRVVVGVTLLFSLLYLSHAGMQISTFGPFALIDERFAFERFVVPTKALVISAALGIALAILGFSLGLVRDATVAALLAEKMSAREKVFMTLLVMGALMIGTYLSEHHNATKVVQLPGATDAERSVVRVAASAAVDAPSREENAALAATAQHCADELGALAQYLGCRSFPPVFIVHRRDLAGGEFVAGDLKPGQGVLVRANLTATEFQAAKLDEWLLRHTLLAQSSSLAGRERNAWVLDGLTWWWPRSQHGKIDGLDAAARDAARAAMPADFSPRDLRAWFSTRKKLGDEKARVLAGSGLAVLAQKHGIESCQRFLSAMLARPLPADFRGWARDIVRPAPGRLRSATGIDEATFVAEWRAALAPPQP